ncbi:MAG: hypothetical protein IMZ64_06620, partial [Bacteroidetes bacterium]|nr:hypothetical protein [Bacteroidota bacterium]
MGELKLREMTMVTDLTTAEEFDVLRDFLQPMADPKNITHSINFWKGEINGASEEEKVEINGIIRNLKNLLKTQSILANANYNVYEVKPGEEEHTERVNADKIVRKEKSMDPSKAHLHVVRDEVETDDTPEIKALREKYGAF